MFQGLTAYVFSVICAFPVNFARGFGSDQEKGMPPPPIQKVPPGEIPDVALPACDELGGMALRQAIERRRSRRKYSAAPLSAAELSFLLWATQGVQKVFREGMAAFRTVPSGGARHPFETVLVVRNVSGVGPGRYSRRSVALGVDARGSHRSPSDEEAAGGGIQVRAAYGRLYAQ